MTHRYHPNPEAGDPPEAILWDDCERCAEHARRLWSLDRRRAIALWGLMVLWRRQGSESATGSEMDAVRHLHNAVLLIERVIGESSILGSLSAADLRRRWLQQ